MPLLYFYLCYSVMARNVAKALTGAPPTPIIDTKLYSHGIFNVKNESVSKNNVYLELSTLLC